MMMLIQTLLRLSLAGGITCIVVFAATALLRKRLPKVWLYYLWLAAVLRFSIPFSPGLPLAVPLLDLVPASAFSVAAFSDVFSAAAAGAKTSYFSSANSGKAQPAGSDDSLIPAAPGAVSRLDPGLIISVVWASGAAAIFIWRASGYAVTVKKLKKRRTSLSQGRVPVYESALITTPLLAGLLRPAVYLPENFAGAELAVRHELCHLRRGDIWLKWLVQLVVCVHWFNPLVYLMRREMDNLSELACDEAVVRNMDETERKAYGSMLITTLHSVSAFGGPMVAALGSNKRLLQERICAIMKKRILTWKIVTASSLAAVCVISAALLSGILTGCSVAKAADSTPPAVSGPAAASSEAPFVNDPDVVGTWEYLGNVENATGYDPSKLSNQYQVKMYLVFADNGVMNETALSWTKGSLLAAGFDVHFTYSIETIDGVKYLLLQNTVSDKNEVFKWSSASTAFDTVTDKVDLPFVDDPAVLGTWVTVDFVRYIGDFNPSEKWREDGALYLENMVFSKGGAFSAQATGMSPAGITWTKGLVLDPYQKTASAYELKEINGTTYMFFEWKSGDYTLRHMAPQYYVLKKVS